MWIVEVCNKIGTEWRPYVEDGVAWQAATPQAAAALVEHLQRTYPEGGWLYRCREVPADV